MERTIISLFCGVGGIDHPFYTSNFNVKFANDFNEDAVKIYQQNFKHHVTYGDITKIPLNKIPKTTGVLAGFPCQAFSIAGHRLGFKDTRGTLFFNVLEVINTKKPDFFLLENVPGLVSHDNGNTFKVIINSLQEIGYHVKYNVLSASEYGNIPQCRRRIYIVGFKNKAHCNNFTFPEKIKLTNSIENVIDFNAKVDNKYYYTAEKYPKAYNLLKDAKLKDKTVYQIRRHYIRENKSGVCPTLTANMGTGGHNVPIIKTKYGIRKLTPAECFMLQGFPKNFNIAGISNASAYTRAGNSVCVKVIERIKEEIVKAMV
ncbi:MAG: DNA cytosine methyltransferase [Mycoplasmataceae bacterium]|jgi:DNA (cytosine-5)-methyltransferase 1|nr:DNA cytosine methyltransferase [Mycoplasmataceae bacterium]